MNKTDFADLQQSVQAVFSTLYLVDTDTLNAEQRQQHQAALSAAYLAYVKAENLDYRHLTDTLKLQLPELAQQVQWLDKRLGTLTTPAARLQLAAGNVDALSRLAYLLDLLDPA